MQRLPEENNSCFSEAIFIHIYTYIYIYYINIHIILIIYIYIWPWVEMKVPEAGIQHHGVAMSSWDSGAEPKVK